MTNPSAAPKSDPTIETRQLNAKSCISQAWTLLKEFARILLPMSLFAFVVGLVLGKLVNSLMIPSIYPLGFAEGTPASTFVGVLGMLLGAFLWLGLSRTCLKVVDRGPDRPRFGDVFSGGRFLLRYLAAVAFVYCAVMIGLILLIVPGLYLAMRFSFFTQAMVDQNLGPGEALRHSWEITHTNQRQIVVLYLLSFGILLGGMLALYVGLIGAAPLVCLATTIAYRWLTSGSAAVAPRNSLCSD